MLIVLFFIPEYICNIFGEAMSSFGMLRDSKKGNIKLDYYFKFIHLMI